MCSSPLLAVLSGPSGVGKDAVIAALRRRGLPLHYAVTATTRVPRPDERDGADYYFVSEEEFDQLVRDDALLEWAWVYGRRYGVPRAPIRQALQQSQSVIIKADVQGAATIRRNAPETLLLFLAPPSLELLRIRMRARGDQDPVDIERRLAAAQSEMDRLPEFDYCVVNHDGTVEQAADQVAAILTAESCRVGRRVPSI